MSLMEAERIAFKYGDRTVLQEVSLAVEKGEVLALLGPNGSGKSSLLKILLGLLAPAAGRVLLDEQPIAQLSRSEMARKMAYVPQAHSLSFPYVVRDVVMLGRLAHQSFYGGYSNRDRSIVMSALGRLGIQHLAQRPYTAISGGERQLVLIARALAQGARLLIMDEPVSGLDYGNQLRLLEHIRNLAAEGYTVIKSTHFPDHAFQVSDKVVLLSGGTAIAQGHPLHVMTKDVLRRLYRIELEVVIREDGLAYCVPATMHPSMHPKGTGDHWPDYLELTGP